MQPATPSPCPGSEPADALPEGDRAALLRELAAVRAQARAAEARAADLDGTNARLARSMGHLAAEASPDAFVRRLHRELCDLLGGEGTAQFRLDPERRRVCGGVMVTVGGDVAHDPATLDQSLDEIPALSGDLTEDRVLRFDVERDAAVMSPHTVEFMRRTGLSWLVNLPLFVSGRPRWVVAVAGREPARLTAGNLELFQLLCRQLTLALELRQLADERQAATVARERERAAEERAAELAKANAALRRGVERLAGEQHIGAILGAFLAEAVATVSASGAGAVMLRVADTATTFEPAAVWDEGLLSPAVIASHPYLGRYTELSGADPAGIFTALARGTMPSYPVEDLRQSVPLAYAYHRERGHRAIWHAPLLLRGEVLGFLALALTEGELPGEAERETVAALAQQLVLAVELTRLSEKAQVGGVLAERHRLAREIHDTIAQALAGVSVHLTAAELDVPADAPATLREHLAQARELARTGLAEARRSILALRPEALDGSTLCVALAERAAALAATGGPHLSVHLAGTPRPIPGETETELLRIGQEAITNAVRHAGAGAVEVLVEFAPGTLTIRVRDDGRGFDPAQPGSPDGFGLLGMRERAARVGGELTLLSRPDAGAEVRLRVPLD